MMLTVPFYLRLVNREAGDNVVKNYETWLSEHCTQVSQSVLWVNSTPHPHYPLAMLDSFVHSHSDNTFIVTLDQLKDTLTDNECDGIITDKLHDIVRKYEMSHFAISLTNKLKIRGFNEVDEYTTCAFLQVCERYQWASTFVRVACIADRKWVMERNAYSQFRKRCLADKQLNPIVRGRMFMSSAMGVGGVIEFTIDNDNLLTAKTDGNVLFTCLWGSVNYFELMKKYSAKTLVL